MFYLIDNPLPTSATYLTYEYAQIIVTVLILSYIFTIKEARSSFCGLRVEVLKLQSCIQDKLENDALISK